jgi:exonuclease VII small subunit
MLINDHLTEIETAITQLQSSEKPIEEQITLYHDTMKRIEHLHKKMQTLSDSIRTPTP